MKIIKTPTVSEFISALNLLFENAEEVCKMLVSMVDANPRVYDEIIKANPKLTYNFLGNLERVGRGQLYFGLICDSSPGARRLLSLPPSLQKQVYEKPVKIASIYQGKTVVVEKPIQQLTKQEVSLAFEQNGKPRDVEAQAAILRAPHQPSHAAPAQRYHIISEDECIVESKTTFNRATLREVLTRMDAMALGSLPSSVKKNQIK